MNTLYITYSIFIYHVNNGSAPNVEKTNVTEHATIKRQLTISLLMFRSRTKCSITFWHA